MFGWGLQLFVFGVVLGLCSKSHRMSSILWSSSIGFTAVKNTDCLSLLRLLLPGINPLLIIECISLRFPMWWMYSVKSSGNSTLSCNAGSTRLPLLNVPELLWNTRSVRKSSGKNSQAVLEPFLWSSHFYQKSYPRINWPLRSTTELCLELFHNVVKSHCSIICSRNWWIMSQ